MNNSNAEDTLFLAAQAEATYRLTNPLFGKIVTISNERTAESILYLHPLDETPLPSLEQFQAIIVANTDTRVSILQSEYKLAVIVVAEDIVLSSGDIITVSERGRIHRHFRALSQNNAFLVTEVCNNLCIMCPQPPKAPSLVDHAMIEKRLLDTLALIGDEHLPESLCITGGEPTMLKEGLIRIVGAISERSPQTLIHLLTNGRYFCHEPYVARLAKAGGPQLLAGIPLFGHVSEIHDYVVQGRGAFTQTMAGLLNCYRQGIRVELRVVLHKVTVNYLKELAEFICANLFFVKHVALMGMENMGYAKLNREDVFIDPWEYRDSLSAAIDIFQLYGIDVRVFNLPLCVVNPDTQPYCAQSISDFKNIWHPECERCVKRENCCGFFSSSTEKFWLSHHIQPFTCE